VNEKKRGGGEKFMNIWKSNAQQNLFVWFYKKFLSIWEKAKAVKGQGGAVAWIFLLCHEQFDVASADVVTVLNLNGSFSFGVVLKIDHGLARRTSVTVAVDLDTLRTQLLQQQQQQQQQQ